MLFPEAFSLFLYQMSKFKDLFKILFKKSHFYLIKKMLKCIFFYIKLHVASFNTE